MFVFIGASLLLFPLALLSHPYYGQVATHFVLPGIQGGISDGEEIFFNVAFKPTATIMKPQMTVDVAAHPVELINKGRHDPCLLPRFVVMGEAMLALVLVDHWLRQRAQCGS